MRYPKKIDPMLDGDSEMGAAWMLGSLLGVSVIVIAILGMENRENMQQVRELKRGRQEAQDALSACQLARSMHDRMMEATDGGR